MEKRIMSKGVISFYIMSMLLTYLVVIRVDSLNSITPTDQSLVYNETISQ